MAKKRKHRNSVGTTGNSGARKDDLSELAVKTLCTLGGVIVGSQIKKLVEKKDDASGTDLLGLNGDMSKYVSSGIVAAAGAAGVMLLKNKYAREFANGTFVAGVGSIINIASGKSIVALGNAEEDDNTPYILPVVNGALPGIGAAASERKYGTALPGIGNSSDINSDAYDVDGFGDIYPLIPDTATPYNYSLDPQLSEQPLQGEETLYGAEQFV